MKKLGLKIFLPKSNIIPEKQYIQTIDEKNTKSNQHISILPEPKSYEASSSICAFHLPKCGSKQISSFKIYNFNNQIE